MKLVEHNTSVTGNLEFAESWQAEIDVDSMQEIIASLTSGLYSDPFLAVLREYTSNAVDAHFAVGQTRPVEVTLPSTLNPNLIIQDWGTGIDRDNLIGYTKFGRSDKRHSNEYIGGFGLGSKSALAIASSFTVISVKDGLKNVLVYSIGENGFEGGFMDDFPKPTTDPNGTKVIIPTREVYKFQRAIDRGMFFAYQPGAILVDGHKQPSIYEDDSYKPILDPADGTTILGWHSARKIGGRDTTAAFVGPVRYTVEWDKLEGEYPASLREGYLSEILLNIPNGEVDIPRSRENLIYKTRTKNTIKSLVNKLVEMGKKVYLDQVAQSTDYRSAIRVMNNAISNGFTGDYFYKGEKIEFLPYDDREFAMQTVTEVSATRTGTGIGSSRTRMNHGDMIKEGWRNRMLNSEPILVIEAGDIGYAGSTHGVHEIVGMMNMFSRGRMDKGETRINKPVIFTSARLSDIDKWTRRLFVETITGEQFKKEATEFRREIGRRARKSVKAVKPVEDVVRRYNRNGNVWNPWTELKLGELDVTRTYILLQSGASDTIDKYIRALTTNVGREDHKSIYQLMSEFLRANQNIEILFANKSWKTEAYRQILPNWTTVEVAYTAWAKTLLPGVPTQIEQTAMEDFAAGTSHWAHYFPTNRLDEIDRQETRDWVAAMRKGDTNSATRQKIGDARRAGLYLETPAPGATVTPLPASPGKRYPLLMDSWRLGDLDASIQYMNLMDAHLASQGNP